MRNSERRRAPNFTVKEVETLIYCLELRPELVEYKSKKEDEPLTNFDRQKLWIEVASEINSIPENVHNNVTRNHRDVKKKWKDLKFRVKSKATDIKSGKLSDIKTPVSLLEERVLQLIENTATVKEFNAALPPAYFNVLGKRKHDKVVEEDASSVEDTSVEHKGNSDDSQSNIIQASPVVKFKPQETFVNMPHITGIPVISLAHSLPVRKPVKLDAECQTVVGTSSRRFSEHLNQNYEVDLIQTLCESQNELKVELKEIRKIMFSIYQQERKRVEQENEKIQLTKMKIMLKCKEQGIDYDKFTSDFV